LVIILAVNVAEEGISLGEQTYRLIGDLIDRKKAVSSHDELQKQ
jgi:hypothetical protein